MLVVETFCDSPNNANTYLIASDKYAIVIDPANSIKTLRNFIGDKKLCGILLTHGHYDHFKSLEELMNQYEVNCWLHPSAILKLKDLTMSCAKFFYIDKMPNLDEQKLTKLKDNQDLALGDISIKVFYTPGHTNCSITYLIGDALFTGDTLFKQSVGRTDLPTGSLMTLNNSLNRLKSFKKDYLVYPGHDQSTSLFEEIKKNPYLK